MTRMRGASFASGEPPVGKEVSCRAKLPPNAPDIIIKHTVTVSDPSCILYHYRGDRRRQFNSLVRRYKQQILHGCENPDCKAPTCLSFRRRTTQGPFRQYTDLSARTLACYLASQDNPERGLCRNQPKKSEEHQSAHTHRQSRNGDIETSQSSRFSSRGTRHEPQQSPVSMNMSIDVAENYDEDPVFSTSSKTKDPKSFTQNLFDTLSLRMVEWLPLRQTNSETHRYASPMLQGGRTPYPHAARKGSNDKSLLQDEFVDPRVHTNAVRNVATNEVHTPTNRQKKAHHPSLELRVSGQPLKRVSLEQTEPWIPTPRSTTDSKSRSHRLSSQQSTPSKTLSQQSYVPPPALKHHSRRKDQYTSDSVKKTANPRRVSWDGSKTSKGPPNDSRNKEMAKQKDSLGNSSPQVTSSQDPQGDSGTTEVTCVAQCVSHLSVDIVDGLYQLLAGNEEDARTWKEEVENMNIQGRSVNYKWRYSTRRQRRAYLFVVQSVFYGLSSSQQLLRSFRQVASPSKEGQGFRGSDTVEFHDLEPALRKVHEICPGDMILHSLWNSLERVFVPPERLPVLRRSSRRVSLVSAGNRSSSLPAVSISEEPLTDTDAAHTLTVVMFVLITFVPKVDRQTWRGIQQVREAGTVLPGAEMQKLSPHSARMLVEVTDKLENEMALRLVQRLVRALVVRLTFHDISKTMADPLSGAEFLRAPSVLDLVFDNLCEHHQSSENAVEPNQLPLAQQSPGRAAVIVEWLRTLFLKEWDGKPEIARSGTAGGVVQILSFMYKDRARLGLGPEDFHTAFLSERLDAMEMPVEWYGRASTGNRKMHLLSFTFLFPPSTLVKYFRAINYSAMSKAYEAGMVIQRQASQTAFNRTIQIADEISLLEHLHTSMTQYFVISVRRDHVLLDAFNQIWRRERRELMRPLKVKMGMDLGEEGVDLGGVQQEFMTLVFSEALDVAHGMFTVDPRTHMAWFQPCSFERLEYFELVGILMSLAVYNGLTLPITFPTAFYRKLLGRKIKRVDHIRDGWPDLAKGLESLLTWSEGDVGDVFMRSYEFSFEAFGTVQTVDMKAIAKDAEWPDWSPLSPGPTDSRGSGSSLKHDPVNREPAGSSDTWLPGQAPMEEPEMVTNETRNQYVEDYLYWLTDRSIRPQYEAFARGFFACIDRISLSVFTPEALKTLVEGTQEIDMDELQRCATYDGGWDADHPLIAAFWKIVKQYSQEEKARLLEFVTASDRIPVNGISSINFVIQRNGTGDDRLPTSYTCYGRLLLPEYTSPEALAKNLDMALKNSRGFGNF